MAASDFAVLWDQFDKVISQVELGYQTCKEIELFLTDRAEVEKTYARSLHELSKKYSKTTIEAGTLGDSWKTIKQQTETMGKQHEQLGIQFVRDVCMPVSKIRAEQKKKREANIKEQERQTAKLEAARAKHNTAIQKYYNLGKQTDLADAECTACMSDPKKHGPAEAKAKKLRLDFEKAEEEYRKKALPGLVEAENGYFETLQKILRDFQTLEMERYDSVTALLKTLMFTQEAAMTNAHQGVLIIRSKIDSINKVADSNAFVAATTKNTPIPQNTQYMAYTSGAADFALSKSFSTAKLDVVKSSASSTGGSSSAGGGINGGAVSAKALFDYNGADTTELTFVAGDVITNIAKDASGWWEGELKGKRAVFPANHVEELPSTPSSPVPRSPSPAPAGGGGGGGGSGKKATHKILYDYTADTEDELSVKEGDSVIVLEEIQGWFKGTNLRTNKTGMFPGNYAEKL